MKKILVFVLGIFILASFVSANLLDDLSYSLYRVDPNVIGFVLVFLVVFALVFFGLTRTNMFASNRVVPAVVSLALALAVSYYMNYTGFSATQYLESFGLSVDSLYLVVIVVSIIVFVFMAAKLGFLKALGTAFIILGIFLFIAGYQAWVYDDTLSIILGIIFFVIGLYFVSKKNRRGFPVDLRMR